MQMALVGYRSGIIFLAVHRHEEEHVLTLGVFDRVNVEAYKATGFLPCFRTQTAPIALERARISLPSASSPVMRERSGGTLDVRYLRFSWSFPFA